MSKVTTLNDNSIQRPEEDRYGFDPFARALARGVAGMAAPEGMVLAVIGPWGSGKSGVINLVAHHLQPEVESGRLQVVQFNPWWFDGKEALTRGFFETFQAALGGALGKKARKVATEAVNVIYQRVKPAKPFLAVAGNIATGTPTGTVASAAADLAIDYLNAKRSVEREYKTLTEVLRQQPKRFLFVIDDIDRLDADESILVFRLIKSVGRLPNVIYIIAFDRAIADHHLGHRFGEAASTYLEKIVQVSYELPKPVRPLLLQALVAELDGVLPLSEGVGRKRFVNLLHDSVAPWLVTPRDIVRLVNAVRTGWPSVAGEINPTDFLALEAIKLAYPDTHRAVQLNSHALCGVEQVDGWGHRTLEDMATRYDAMLIVSVVDGKRDAMRIALRRLFPRLDSVWSNLWHGMHSVQEWRRDRLVCSRDHFDTYFLLSPGEGTVPAAELAGLLANLESTEYVQTTFLSALAIRRRTDGVSRAALLLDEVGLRAAEITADAVPGLLAALSSIADDLDVPGDDQLPGSGWGNQLRLWSLVNGLSRNRLDQGQRSALLLGLAEIAQPHWLSWLANDTWNEHHPEKEERSERDREPLVTLECAETLCAKSLDAIRQAARVGSLLHHPKLRKLLFEWTKRAGDEGAQVRRWTDTLLDKDEAVVRLAAALTFLGESIGLGGFGFLGDHIATIVPQVDRAALAKVCDADRLAARVEELLTHDLSSEDMTVLRQFAEGLRGPGAASAKER